MSVPFIIFFIFVFILLETYSSEDFSKALIASIILSLILLFNSFSRLSLASIILLNSSSLRSSFPSILNAELIESITLFPSTTASFRFLLFISSSALSIESFNEPLLVTSAETQTCNQTCAKQRARPRIGCTCLLTYLSFALIGQIKSRMSQE